MSVALHIGFHGQVKSSVRSAINIGSTSNRIVPIDQLGKTFLKKIVDKTDHAIERRSNSNMNLNCVLRVVLQLDGVKGVDIWTWKIPIFLCAVESRSRCSHDPKYLGSFRIRVKNGGISW